MTVICLCNNIWFVQENYENSKGNFSVVDEVMFELFFYGEY